MTPKVPLRVVVVYPSDVEDEIVALQNTIWEVNRILGPAGRSVVLELAHWRTDVYPGFRLEGSQAWIDSILKPEESDILIGIFWKRIGSAGAGGTSGAEHEIRLAYDAATNKGKPHIMLLFNQAPYSPKLSDETDQWGKVLKFKDEVRGKAVYAEYLPETFKDQVRSYLLSYMFDTYPAPPTAKLSGMTVPLAVRAEGLTEKIGDITLTFRDYPLATYDIWLFLNVNVTNRIISNRITDAALWIAGNQLIRGELAETNIVIFRRVAILSSQVHARITNVRADANAPGVVAGLRPLHITATLAIQLSGSTAAPEAVDLLAPTAFVERSFVFRMPGIGSQSVPTRISRSLGVNALLLNNVVASVNRFTMYLEFSELIQTHFGPEQKRVRPTVELDC